jgi:hypothetical protein
MIVVSVLIFLVGIRVALLDLLNAASKGIHCSGRHPGILCLASRGVVLRTGICRGNKRGPLVQRRLSTSSS